jgi:hypothetical protein
MSLAHPWDPAHPCPMHIHVPCTSKGTCHCRCMSHAHCCMSRVGQNHIYTVYIRYFWQGNHQIYGHIRCIYTVLANPMHVPYTSSATLPSLFTAASASDPKKSTRYVPSFLPGMLDKPKPAAFDDDEPEVTTIPSCRCWACKHRR